jgi:hypothetical protein
MHSLAFETEQVLDENIGVGGTAEFSLFFSGGGMDDGPGVAPSRVGRGCREVTPEQWQEIKKAG